MSHTTCTHIQGSAAPTTTSKHIRNRPESGTRRSISNRSRPSSASSLKRQIQQSIGGSIGGRPSFSKSQQSPLQAMPSTIGLAQLRSAQQPQQPRLSQTYVPLKASHNTTSKHIASPRGGGVRPSTT
jgi:hypothetical protein